MHEENFWREVTKIGVPYGQCTPSGGNRKCFTKDRAFIEAKKYSPMGGTCGTYGGRERCAQGFGGET